ncbi:MAG: hypothetical protein AAF458_16125 [Pseudomonadota bacterium]
MDSVAGVFVPVDVLAREQGTTADAVVEKIQSGALVGRKQSNGWHVLVRVPGSSAAAEGDGEAQPAAPGAAASAPAAAPARAELSGPIQIDGVTDVVVRDVQIRYGTMVRLMFKFLFACIPVAVVLGVLIGGAWWIYSKYGDLLLSYVRPYLS